MSADMLITSGSSFTAVAATVSYKPVVLFDKPKEGGFFGVYMDGDYVKYVLNSTTGLCIL